MLYKHNLTFESIEAQPCYMFHGFLGNGVNLYSVAKMIGSFVRPIVLDLPNHGNSEHISPGDFTHTIQCINEYIEQEQQQSGNSSYTLLGHSLGAKYAMMQALQNPSAVSSLVVLDIAPMKYPSHNRVYIDAYKKVLARQPKSRKEAIKYLSDFVEDQAILFFLAKNFYYKDDKIQMHINLEELDKHYNNLEGFPEKYNSHRYDGPTLFLRAENTDYFNDEAESHIKTYFSNYTIVRIPQSSHALHIDNPQAVQNALHSFYANL